EPTFTQLAQDIYAKQQYTDALGRHLAYDAYSTETGVSSLRIASKSGSIRGVRNDAGVIQEEGLAYAIAVMTKGCPDERFYANNPGILAIADTSRVIHQYLRHGKGPDVAARS
ncbi:MAG TPA: serine hydrolase, partial [Trueperaceae bacterium]